MGEGYETLNLPVEFSIPFTQSFVEGEDGEKDTFLEFLGSSTDLSLSGHKMSESAIADMKSQAVGLPMFVNHNPDKVFAIITSVRESSPSEFRPVAKMFRETGDPIIDEPVKTVNNWRKQGVDLGASIGAVIQKAKFTEL